MKNTFLEKLSTMQDHMKMIFDNYTLLNPDYLPGQRKTIKIDDNYHLDLSQYTGTSPKTSLYVSLNETGNKLSSHLVNFEQDDYNRNTSEKEVRDLFEKHNLENVIIKESEKLEEKLGYSYSRDLPVRSIFELPDDGSKLYISKLADKMEMQIDFPKLHKQDSNDINGNYDHRVLQNTFSVFNESHAGSAFQVKGSPEEVKQKFMSFYDKVLQINSLIFKPEIRNPLELFKEELTELKIVILNLDLTKEKQKKLKM